MTTRAAEWQTAAPDADERSVSRSTACEDPAHVPPIGQRRPGSPPRLRAYTLDELRSVRFPQRPALIRRGEHGVILRGTISELFAYRGLGKTWLAHTLALIVAAGTEAFGWSAPERRTVLLVDGEMPGDLVKERLIRLADMLGIEACPQLRVVGADWQPGFLPRVDTVEGQTALEPFVAAADFVIFDNRSCLLDVEGEKDPAAWQPTQDYLLALRRRGKASLLVHHANRGGGARGLGKAEDVMDVVLKLSRPDDYRTEQGARFRVDFDKARGLYGDAAQPFVIGLTGDGWQVDSISDVEQNGSERKIRDYLRNAEDVGELPKSANAAVRGAGVMRQPGLAAFARMLKAGSVVKDPQGGYHLAV